MVIGLIAHDSKKTLMQNLCIAYRKILSEHMLYATGTTGRLVEEASGLSVHKFLDGRLGGAEQMGSCIEQNQLDMVIFLRDPSVGVFSREPENINILQLCDNHNIPLATNLATAELLIKALERGDLEWREVYR